MKKPQALKAFLLSLIYNKVQESLKETPSAMLKGKVRLVSKLYIKWELAFPTYPFKQVLGEDPVYKSNIILFGIEGI